MTIMNSEEEYARRWTKSEGDELDTLSEWIKSIQKLLKSRIKVAYSVSLRKIKSLGFFFYIYI